MTNTMIRISRFLVLGDSLSDRGTLNNRYLAGVIPMRIASGLSSKSPRGRFTNGFLWGDYVTATTAEQFEINKVRDNLKLDHTARSNADISDEFIANYISLPVKDKTAFSLNNDQHVLFEGQRFARFHCEGGLTAHDYSRNFTFNLVHMFSRLVLATLNSKANQVIQEDRKYKISRPEKNETVVIEWSGANDLITVNSEPTHKEVDNAITDRINNLELLIKQGYRNFVLFNLPDLSLTPRYSIKSKELRDNAAECSTYFNQQLQQKVMELQEQYKLSHPNLYLSVFDVSSLFKKVYNDPKAYDFDVDKIHTPYTSSDEFKKNQNNPVDCKNHTSPSEGYMFWDDVHPTADMQAWLAENFNENYASVFNFTPPSKQVLVQKEAEDVILSADYDDSPPFPAAKLPENIGKILNDIYARAQQMCNSDNLERRKKGLLLEQFVFDVKLQRGNLEEVYKCIKQFTMDAENVVIMSTRKNRFFDCLTRKHTSTTQKNISALEHIIDDSMAKIVQHKLGQETLVLP